MQIAMSKQSQAMMKGLLNDTGKLYNRTAYRALKNARSKTKTQLGKDIREIYNLPAQYVNNKIKMLPASYVSMRFVTRTSDTPTGLKEFKGTKQLKLRGTKVKVMTKGPAEVLQRHFVANVPKAEPGESHAHVFTRKWVNDNTPKPFNKKINYSALPREYRYKLTRKTGPRVVDVFSRPQFAMKIMNFADKELQSQLNYQLNRELRKM